MHILEELWYGAAVAYAKYYTFVKHHFGIERQKLFFFVRNIRKARVIKVGGLLFQMNPEVSTSFARMLGGAFNEEGTHELLYRVIKGVESIDLFVDVGSNIGEFVVDIGSLDGVGYTIGFEPNPACVNSCLKSIELNRLKNVRVVQKILSDSRKEVHFNLHGEHAHIHSIFDQPTSESDVVDSSTLDDELQNVGAKVILLIDVEGAETLVMKGGKKFIDRNFPFIIFEYNHISRRHFTLEEVRKLLPQGYQIFRLRSDGYLDDQLENSSNCVAVHKNSSFRNIESLLFKRG